MTVLLYTLGLTFVCCFVAPMVLLGLASFVPRNGDKK